jgi:broad specificity phosphatase PhoE
MMVLSQATEPNRTPKVYLVRPGETAWTISGQHTGRSDIPLTERGERDAQELSARL